MKKLLIALLFVLPISGMQKKEPQKNEQPKMMAELKLAQIINHAKTICLLATLSQKGK